MDNPELDVEYPVIRKLENGRECTILINEGEGKNIIEGGFVDLYSKGKIFSLKGVFVLSKSTGAITVKYSRFVYTSKYFWPTAIAFLKRLASAFMPYAILILIATAINLTCYLYGCSVAVYVAANFIAFVALAIVVSWWFFIGIGIWREVSMEIIREKADTVETTQKGELSEID